MLQFYIQYIFVKGNFGNKYFSHLQFILKLSVLAILWTLLPPPPQGEHTRSYIVRYRHAYPVRRIAHCTLHFTTGRPFQSGTNSTSMVSTQHSYDFYLNTHAHARTHGRTHTRTHTHTPTNTHTQEHTKDARPHENTHARTHGHTHTQKHTHI